MLARVIDQSRSRVRVTTSLEPSLDAAAQWMACAQDAGADDGVAAYQDVRRKSWAASYPEATGYIIPTLYYYTALRGCDEFHERATRTAVWECEVQLPCGGEAWRRVASSFAGHALNTYNTRVAFGLALAAHVLGEDRYLCAARAKVEWAFTQAHENGWLDNNDLEDDSRPLTHTIAYAIRGILEVGALTDDVRLIDRADAKAASAARVQRRDGAPPRRLDSEWRPLARWNCLTGNVPVAIIWLRLTALTGNAQRRAHAERAIAYTRGTQLLDHGDPGRRGESQARSRSAATT